MFINFKIREVYKVKRPYKNHSLWAKLWDGITRERAMEYP